MMKLRPRKSAWLPLLIVGLPIAALGIAAIIDGGILVGLAAVAFAGIVVGFNATVRLTVDAERITLTRYGLRVWSAPTSGLIIENGLGGELPLLPAYVFTLRSKRIGFVLRGWFKEADMAILQKMLANDS